MGMHLFFKALNLSSVLNIHVDKRNDVYKEVKQTTEYMSYSKWIDKTEGRGVMDKALYSLIFKGPTTELPKYVYSYAFICLCLQQGHKLPFEERIMFGHDTDIIQQCLIEDFGVLLDYSSLHPLTPPLDFDDPNDAPYWIVLTQKDIQDLLGQLSLIDIVAEEDSDITNNVEDEDIAFAHEYIKGIKKNLIKCEENSLDLVVFIY